MVKGEKEGGLIGIGEVRELDMSQVGVWDAALWLLWRQSWFQGVLVHSVILIKAFLCPEKKTYEDQEPIYLLAYFCKKVYCSSRLARWLCSLFALWRTAALLSAWIHSSHGF